MVIHRADEMRWSSIRSQLLLGYELMELELAAPNSEPASRPLEQRCGGDRDVQQSPVPDHRMGRKPISFAPQVYQLSRSCSGPRTMQKKKKNCLSIKSCISTLELNHIHIAAYKALPNINEIHECPCVLRAPLHCLTFCPSLFYTDEDLVTHSCCYSTWSRNEKW